MTDHSDHNHSDEISTLNTLIATTIDSVTGYENSAKDIDNQQFAQIFRQRADERALDDAPWSMKAALGVAYAINGLAPLTVLLQAATLFR